MTPIFISMNYDNIGNVSGMKFAMEILASIYITQLIFMWSNLIMEMEDFKSKLHFLYWNIPFIPIIVLFIKKLSSINKD